MESKTNDLYLIFIMQVRLEGDVNDEFNGHHL